MPPPRAGGRRVALGSRRREPRERGRLRLAAHDTAAARNGRTLRWVPAGVADFEAEALMPVEPEVAFDLSLSIDLHLDSFAHTGETAVAGVSSGTIRLGEFVTWRARHFGVTWTMTSFISEWDRPHRFVDEQRSGPFKSFRHEHTFEPVAGGTRLRDRVEFAAPLGVLGRIAERLVLTAYLRRLIDVRNSFLVGEATRIGAARPGAATGG